MPEDLNHDFVAPDQSDSTLKRPGVKPILKRRNYDYEMMNNRIRARDSPPQGTLRPLNS